MSVETAISIVKAGMESTLNASVSVPGLSPAARAMQVLEYYRAMPYDQFLKMHAAQSAQAYFKGMPGRIAAWMNRIKQLQGTYRLLELTRTSQADVAFQSALNRLAAQEAVLSQATSMSAATAAEGTLVAGAGTTVLAIVIPIVGVVAVGMALGAPYYLARKRAEREEHVRGFARGFIMGLLKWDLRFAIDRFWDNAVTPNHFDDDMPKIRAQSHNEALIEGRIAGLAKTATEKKECLEGLRLLTNASTAGWKSRNDSWGERMRARGVQINYVIDLAAAAMKSGIVAKD